MAPEPTSPWPRTLEDVDQDLEERTATLGRLVTAVEALREEMEQSHALVDVAVVMQEARTYADATRQEADVYAERVKATADAEAAALRQATAEACAAQAAEARETVAQIYQEGQEKVAALETAYTERRTALAEVHAALRGAWTEYADRLQTAAHTVTTLLADPPVAPPTRDRLPGTPAAAAGTRLPPAATMAPRLTAKTEPSMAAEGPAMAPALAPDRVPFDASAAPALRPDALEPVDAPLALSPGVDPDAPLPGLGAPPARPLVARDQVVPKLVERPLG
jgi:hypothetical protein